MLSGKWPQLPQEIKTKDSRLAEFILRNDLQAATVYASEKLDVLFSFDRLFEFAVYLQGCLACKRCSACSLPYHLYQTKANRASYQTMPWIWNKWIFEFFTTTKCARPSQLSRSRSPSGFCFSQVSFSSVSGNKALKKRVCVLPYSFTIKGYGTFWKQVSIKHAVIAQKSLSEKTNPNQQYVYEIHLFMKHQNITCYLS